MPVDKKYLKSILNEFNKAAPGSLTVIELAEAGLWVDSVEEQYKAQRGRFLDHMQELERLGFIERRDGVIGIGIDTGWQGSRALSAVPLFLTRDGSEFLES